MQIHRKFAESNKWNPVLETEITKIYAYLVYYLLMAGALFAWYLTKLMEKYKIIVRQTSPQNNSHRYISVVQAFSCQKESFTSLEKKKTTQKSTLLFGYPLPSQAALPLFWQLRIRDKSRLYFKSGLLKISSMWWKMSWRSFNDDLCIIACPSSK